MNPITTLFAITAGGIIVLSKALWDSFKGERFKYDTVTDLRQKRKMFNDKTYKNTSHSSKGTKGI